MWWYEESVGNSNDGMWRRMKVFDDGGVWHGEPNISYGPGGYAKGKWWTLIANPSPVVWDRLCDSPWIARV